MAKVYLALFYLLFVFTPLFTNAATLSISPSSGSYSVGNSFTVGVYAGSADQAMNAASGVISFPQDKLEVVSVSKSGSIFSFWAEEPAYSNANGSVSFEGIAPNPGFIGSSGKIITIKFRVKAGGAAAVSFLSSSALANDGKGTNILTGTGTARFTLGTAVPVNQKADKEKPSYFDIAEILRQDETDPRAKFIFDASDDIGIDHYEIMIDGKDLGRWKNDETDRYEAPAYGPGKHTIIVKAVDKAGNVRSSTLDFFIKGLDVPVFNKYPKNLQSGEVLMVQGSTYPLGEVRVWLEKRGDEPKSFVVHGDKDGQFTFVSDGLTDGVYDLWAEASDDRGARSLPTEKITTVVSKSAMFHLGNIAVNFLSILIPLLAMIFVLLFILLHGWHKLSTFRKRLHKEVQEAEGSLHKSFDFMREQIRESVMTLEKTNAKRELTKEEDKILKQFKKNLTDTEKLIAKEIGSIERKI